MGSTVKMFPFDFPITSRDSNQMFKYFPREIWLLILEQLTDVQDLENVKNASPFFYKLLHSKRAEFLFPKVCNILARYPHAPSEKPQSRKTLKATWCSALLKFRQVCTTWRNSVDKMCQMNALEPPPVIPNLLSLPKISWAETSFSADYRHDNSSNILEFLNHFQETHSSPPGVDRNPFISRSVEFDVRCPFSDNNDDPRLEVINGISSLLPLYGHHIHRCTLFSDFPLSNAYLKLVEWLPLMPNLKVLNIQNYLAFGTYTPTELGELDDLIAEKPLSTCKNLEQLLTKDLVPGLLNHLILMNKHVNVICIDFIKSGTSSEHDIYTIPLPNLRQLSFTVKQSEDFYKLATSQFGTLFEKLRLRIYCKSIPLQQIFTLLESKWRNNLTQLHIEWSLVEMEGFTAEQRNKMIEDAQSLVNSCLPGVTKFLHEFHEPYNL